MAEVQSVREFVANVVSALHNLEVRYSEPRAVPLPYAETMCIFDQVLAAHDAEARAKAHAEAVDLFEDIYFGGSLETRTWVARKVRERLGLPSRDGSEAGHG